MTGENELTTTTGIVVIKTIRRHITSGILVDVARRRELYNAQPEF
jgi:hypothetical protein